MRFPGKYVVIGLAIGALTALVFVLSNQRPEPLEIQAVEELKAIPKISTSKKEVIGFYPYWNLNKVKDVDLSHLTTIYYFALDLNSDGTWNTTDPGWGRLKSTDYYLLRDKAKQHGIRWGLTIINLSADGIAKNVNNPTRRNLIISNTVSLMKQEGFQDLNIDLEYIGDPDPGLKANFTTFVRDLTTEVKKEIPGAKVSIDFFAYSYRSSSIFDLPEIGKIVDQVIIMGYDFHRKNSIKAGPVAPMFGKTDQDYAISSTVTGYLTLIPPEKLILGVPFYGYEWPTETAQKGAFTIYSPRGPEISSYHRSIQTAKDNDVSINFDDTSKSVWFSYFDDTFRTWRQVWFENERSLGIKFDLVNTKNLAGIAIFALGYDGANAQPLWNEVKLKLR